MRYRLRTLLILMAIAPPTAAALWYIGPGIPLIVWDILIGDPHMPPQD